jgi:hypothetical protein
MLYEAIGSFFIFLKYKREMIKRLKIFLVVIWFVLTVLVIYYMVDRIYMNKRDIPVTETPNPMTTTTFGESSSSPAPEIDKSIPRSDDNNRNRDNPFDKQNKPGLTKAQEASIWFLVISLIVILYFYAWNNKDYSEHLADNISTKLEDLNPLLEENPKMDEKYKKAEEAYTKLIKDLRSGPGMLTDRLKGQYLELLGSHLMDLQKQNLSREDIITNLQENHMMFWKKARNQIDIDNAMS